MKEAKPKRPTRAILALTIVIVVLLGAAAYFVNVPLLWIAIGETVALLGIGLRASKAKQPQVLAETAHDQATKP